MEGRLTALEGRLTRKRPETNGRRMTRLDRTPYGWKASEKDRAVLVRDEQEQEVIKRIVGMAQRPLSFREMGRRLDADGFRRRRGKLWRGAHTLVRSILRREGLYTPADAEATLPLQNALEKAVVPGSTANCWAWADSFLDTPRSDRVGVSSDKGGCLRLPPFFPRPGPGAPRTAGGFSASSSPILRSAIKA